jgi:probable LLM family oxidoreductase
MQIGIYSFVETTPDPATGHVISTRERLRDLMEEIALADQVGLEIVGIGEHHRPDFAGSAPAVILAAAAERTKSIRLTSAVTVLSTDDPVRVFEQFSTLDNLSGGRAEIMVGRGSFIESFPLFGYDLDDYDALFAEKLDLLMKLRESETITWSGHTRPPLNQQGIYPRPVQNPLPIWIAVGGNPQSVVRAGTLGLPLALAIIGGMPERFAPLIGLYREAARRAGRDPAQLSVGINTHAFVADTAQAAADTFFPSYAEQMSRVGRERGWPPTTQAQFDASCGPRGALAVGSPQQVIDKILFQHEVFKHDRYLAQLAVGTVPHRAMMRAIELLGTKVAPAVRKALASAPPSTAPVGGIAGA